MKMHLGEGPFPRSYTVSGRPSGKVQALGSLLLVSESFASFSKSFSSSAKEIIPCPHIPSLHEIESQLWKSPKSDSEEANRLGRSPLSEFTANCA